MTLATTNRVMSAGLKRQLTVAAANGDEIAKEVIEVLSSPDYPASEYYRLVTKVRYTPYHGGYNVSKRAPLGRAVFSANEFAEDVLAIKYGSSTEAAKHIKASDWDLDRSFTTKYRLTANIVPCSESLFNRTDYAPHRDVSYTFAPYLYTDFLRRGDAEYAHWCYLFFTMVAPCEILQVKDASGKLHGRALIWRNVKAVTPNGTFNLSVMDTPLATSEAAEDVMIACARENNIQLRIPVRRGVWDRGLDGARYLLGNKETQEYDPLWVNSPEKPTKLLVPLVLNAEFPGGFPRDETAGAIVREGDKLCLSLLDSRHNSDTLFTSIPVRYICPICGKLHNYPSMVDKQDLIRDSIIPSWFNLYMDCCVHRKSTVFGSFYECTNVKNHSEYGRVPAECVGEDGRLTPTAEMAFMLAKLSVNFRAIANLDYEY